MKKILILLTIFIFLACNKNYNDLLIGSWQLKNIKTNIKINYPQKHQNAVKHLVQSTNLKFKHNGRFVGKIWDDISFGNWDIKDKTLIINDLASNKKVKLKIIKLNQNRLILEEKKDTIEEVLIFERK